MNLKTLIALAVAAAFTSPLAFAAGDKEKSATSGQSASQGATAKPDGGADAMFSSLDKNQDGSLSREEVKGTPHDKDFSRLDKNKDGKLSRQEHAAAPEHQDKAAAGKSAGNGGSSASGATK